MKNLLVWYTVFPTLIAGMGVVSCDEDSIGMDDDWGESELDTNVERSEELDSESDGYNQADSNPDLDSGHGGPFAEMLGNVENPNHENQVKSEIESAGYMATGDCIDVDIDYILNDHSEDCFIITKDNVIFDGGNNRISTSHSFGIYTQRENVTIQNVIIDGSPSSGIELKGAKVKLQNVKIEGSPAVGIVLDYAELEILDVESYGNFSGLLNSYSNVYGRDCSFTSNPGRGIMAFGSARNYMDLTEIIWSSRDSDGALIMGFGNVFLSNGRSYDTLVLKNTNAFLWKLNLNFNNNGHGVDIDNSYFDIWDCNICGNSERGLFVKNSWGYLTNSTLYSNGWIDYVEWDSDVYRNNNIIGTESIEH